MSKCPYCKEDFTLRDFSVVREYETNRGKIKTKKANAGDSTSGYKRELKMWACPGCDTILGFSEYQYDS